MTYQFGGDGTQQAGGGMANRMKSEAPGSHEDAGQEAMIEFNEMADSAVDEDVIELTDVFSIREDEENGIIELTDMATEEEILEPPNSLAATEDGRAAEWAAPQNAGHEILELADQATAPGASFESQSQDPQPQASLLSQAHPASPNAGGLSSPEENEASSEDELLDFGDLDLGDADLDTVSAPWVEADDAPEEALFLEDQELVDFSDQAEEAAGGVAAEESAAAAQTGGDTRGLLDLDGLATPPEEGVLEGDEFSDIFKDLDSGASAAAEPAERPAAGDEPQGRGAIGPEIGGAAPRVAELPSAVKAMEGLEPLEAGNGEEQFILGAGGIRMREKANDSVQQATPAPAHAAAAAPRSSSAADALVVSAEQVEAAVERVVGRMFSDRIEALLMEVLEKAVSKEIGRIKKALLAASSENDTR